MSQVPKLFWFGDGSYNYLPPQKSSFKCETLQSYSPSLSCIPTFWRLAQIEWKCLTGTWSYDTVKYNISAGIAQAWDCGIVRKKWLLNAYLRWRKGRSVHGPIGLVYYSRWIVYTSHHFATVWSASHNPSCVQSCSGQVKLDDPRTGNALTLGRKVLHICW